MMKIDQRKPDYWDAVAEDLEIYIERDVRISLHGETIEVDVLVKDFGAPNGMLIFSTSDIVREYGERIVEVGYGYSVISSMSFESYDRESTIEMLIDWGWEANRTRTPLWMRTGLNK
jgi:hypothetical protein